ncbi:Protein mak16 [Bienertia sinuspersici]
MQHDEVIWQVIRHNHCSFMSKIETGKFCRNPYNVTGICNRSSCPLANSRYATIREHEGVLYLYMKTIERAHMPNKLWERVKLPRNYMKALEIIDKHLMYWPKFLVHKMKQRLTKMTQMRIRMRKLALKTREKIMTTPRKEMKRDARRLEKAEKAALIDKKIEEELLERIDKGVYDGIYNYNQKHGMKFSRRKMRLSWRKRADLSTFEDEPEVEYVEGYEELEEEEDMEDFGRFPMNEPLGDDSEDGLDEDDDDVGVADKKRSRREPKVASKIMERDESVSKSKKKARVIVEVEHEDAGDRQTATQ